MTLVSATFRGPALACLVASTIFTVTAHAQDMSVYTTVRNAVGQDNRVIAESLTLFHAGKVYDYAEHVGEVVIYEPTQNRFTLIGSNYIGSRVSSVEITQFLNAARSGAERFIESPTRDPRNRKLIPGLKFQLQPEFTETLRPEKLTLNGSCLTYQVATVQPPQGSPLNDYLNYADWAARLNYMLHPQALLPEPRLELNESLRKNKRLPVTVELVAKLDRDMHLKAEHRFAWTLQATDRQFIDQWERTRESPNMRWVSIHEYQEQMSAKTTATAKAN
jgi:hypothetical protein